jgi:small subunit ribosomal protein S6
MIPPIRKLSAPHMDSGAVPREGDNYLMRQYELTFILPPSLAEDEIRAAQETVEGWITSGSGEITKVSHWGRRRLEYPIENYKEGYYILIEFQSDPAIIRDVDRRVRLDVTYIRHLIVHVGD